MKRAAPALFLLLVACKEMVVPAPSRPKGAVDPPPTPPELEARKAANCAPKSHFGTTQASDMLKVPIRWYSDATTDCTMVAPSDMQPFYSLSVLGGEGAEFTNFTQEQGAEFDRDAVPRATKVAWLPKSYTLVCSDGHRLVIVEIGSQRQSPRSQTDARMQATIIASKLLAYF